MLVRINSLAQGVRRVSSRMSAVPMSELHTEARLVELKLRLPAPSKPVASYVMCTRVGNLLYTGELLLL